MKAKLIFLSVSLSLPFLYSTLRISARRPTFIPSALSDARARVFNLRRVLIDIFPEIVTFHNGTIGMSINLIGRDEERVWNLERRVEVYACARGDYDFHLRPE